MYKLFLKNEVYHCLVLLGVYILINTLTGNISSNSREIYLIGAIPNLILAIVCFFYLIKTRISDEINLTKKPIEKSSTMLYYIPLFTLPFLLLFYGVKTNLNLLDIIMLLAMYIGVGFMEEIIFRGLMLSALLKKWKPIVAVLFVSSTFAFGHIASIGAIGQSVPDTILQIANSFVVGLMFTIVMLSSKNIVACIIVHILYNFIANVSNIGSTTIEIVAVNSIITLLYFLYLFFRSNNIRDTLTKPKQK